MEKGVTAKVVFLKLKRFFALRYFRWW